MTRPALTAAAAVALTVVAGHVHASSALETPEGGVQHLGRGGAWLARADDPLVAYYNPAAMATLSSGVHLGASLMIRSYCFDRRGPDGERVTPATDFEPAPDEVCADAPPFPNPQLAAIFRVHRHVAVGLSVVAPHASGGVSWPDTITYANRFGEVVDHPAPTRYLLIKNESLLLFPTVSVGVAITKDLSLGAGFTWGVSTVSFTAMTESISSMRGTPQPDDFSGDILSRIEGVDGIIPGFVASALWAPMDALDLAIWYRYSDAIRTSVDFHTEAPYFEANGQVNPNPAITDIPEAGEFELDIPMEAKLGVRYHYPRDNPKSQEFVTKHGGWARDPMSQDLFDIELDLTWAHNSSIDAVRIRMKPNQFINASTDPANPTNLPVPQNADVPHDWKDTIGVRLGGDYMVIPDTLALRLGGFFESRGQDAELVNIDFLGGWKVGVGGGGTVRLAMFDISLAYQHTFFETLDNGGNGGVRAASGDATVGTNTPDPDDDHRSIQFVNGGSANSSLDEVALGATVHF